MVVIFTKIARLSIAAFCLYGLFLVTKWLSFFAAFWFGICTGNAALAFLFLSQNSEKRRRQEKAILLNSLSRMRKLDLQRLSSTKEFEIPSWISDSTTEKVVWMNNIIKKIWPYFSKAGSSVIFDFVSSFLGEYKLGMITKLVVKRFSLGHVPPLIRGVRFFGIGDNELSMEVEVDWTQKPDQTLVIKVSVAKIAPVMVKVSCIKWKGTVKVILKPLMSVLPGFGAVLLSVTEDPGISMDIAILGGDITAIPGIHRMIDKIVRVSLADLLVWPARMVFPIVPGDYRHLELKPCGYLEVVLVEARDVPKMDFFSKSDPFVYLCVRQRHSLMQRSSVKTNNHFPVWNEVFLIQVEDVASQCLHVQLMDEDMFDTAQYIGSQAYPLSQLRPGSARDVWMDLVERPHDPCKGPARGRVHLCLTYWPYNSEQDLLDSPVGRLTASHSKRRGAGIPYHVFRGSHSAVGAVEEKKHKKLTSKVKASIGKVFGPSGAGELPADVFGDRGITLYETQYLRAGPSSEE